MASDFLRRLPGLKTPGLFALALLAATLCPVARAEVPVEYKMKAAYLYKFINYVAWPSGETFTIGIVGKNPFGSTLASLNGKKVNGRTLSVRELSNPADLKNCQIVFISSSESQRFGAILEGLRNSRILTVSEIEGFAERGGIVNFFTEDNKIRFEINAEAARIKDLRISSELLKLARPVKS